MSIFQIYEKRRRAAERKGRRFLYFDSRIFRVSEYPHGVIKSERAKTKNPFQKFAELPANILVKALRGKKHCFGSNKSSGGKESIELLHSFMEHTQKYKLFASIIRNILWVIVAVFFMS